MRFTVEPKLSYTLSLALSCVKDCFMDILWDPYACLCNKKGGIWGKLPGNGPFLCGQIRNSVFTLKTLQMFSVYTTLEKFVNATTNKTQTFNRAGVVFVKNSDSQITWSSSCYPSAFENPRYKIFFIHTKTQGLSFSNSFGWKSVFEGSVFMTD